jgi:hypothetical protein
MRWRGPGARHLLLAALEAPNEGLEYRTASRREAVADLEVHVVLASDDEDVLA